jgi:hypothetical protein
LGGAPVATYAAAVREGGEAQGRVLGVLGVHFDWGPQADAVMRGVRLLPEEVATTRALILDMQGRVIAASDGVGVLEEVIVLPPNAGTSGFHEANGRVIAHHVTPGYETYRGLNWRGMLVQRLTNSG